MGPAVVSYRFQRMPSVFRYFPRAVFGRRHALESLLVERVEGRVLSEELGDVVHLAAELIYHP